MQTLDITLAANDQKAFDIGGAYFEIIEGAAAVDVNFVDSRGSRAKDLEMLGALPGYWISGPFSRFELKNGTTPQTVRIMFGSGVGGSRRIQGDVGIVDAVTPGCQSVFVSDLTAALTATPFVLPAGNSKGLIVRSIVTDCQAGTAAAQARLIAAAVAPASLTPGANSIILSTAFSLVNATATTTLTSFEMRRRIPPGWGMWMVKNTAAVPLSCGVTCSFEVVP